MLLLNSNGLVKPASKPLINASKKGMMENTNSDAGSDNTLVNVTKLTNSQKVELSKYTLSLINSARSQLGKKPWTYRSGALRFADRVANQYYTHNKSCWDPDHYVAGILRAAKASGLNSNAGQVYEDEAATYFITIWLKSSYYVSFKESNLL